MINAIIYLDMIKQYFVWISILKFNSLKRLQLITRDKHVMPITFINKYLKASSSMLYTRLLWVFLI